MPISNPTACSICHRAQCNHRTRVDRRPAANVRGYDATWRKMRAMVLHDEPLCRECRKRGKYRPAEHVHHEKPLAQYPELRLVRENLTPLCRYHHDAIEAERRKDRW